MATAHPDTAQPCVRDQLDALGPVLCKLGRRRVTLTWDSAGDADGYYFVELRESDDFYGGAAGTSPTEALAAAERMVAERRRKAFPDG